MICPITDKACRTNGCGEKCYNTADQLATSPLVYMLKDGIITAMVPTNGSHGKKTGEEFEGVQYSFTFAYALKDFSQRFQFLFVFNSFLYLVCMHQSLCNRTYLQRWTSRLK